MYIYQLMKLLCFFDIISTKAKETTRFFYQVSKPYLYNMQNSFFFNLTTNETVTFYL